MNRIKQNIPRRYQAILAVLCLCTCLVLGVGASYARYQTDFLAASYWFQSGTYDTIAMHGFVAEKDLDAVKQGTWPKLQSGWSYTNNNSAQLKFSISNGASAEEYGGRNQMVSIQLIASLSVEDPEQLQMTLTTVNDEGEEMQYTGIPAEIPTGSVLHSIYGDGWVYRFYDEENVEQTFLLEGNALDYQNFVLTVTGEVSPSLLSLEISAQYVNSD